jgi:hypothetical protein
MAIWACKQLLPESDFEALRHTFLARELDPEVAAEWKTQGTFHG